MILLWVTECRHYHADAKTKGGCDYTFQHSITKGDTICLNDLLFTHKRDYLIKNNNQHVCILIPCIVMTSHLTIFICVIQLHYDPSF